MPRTEGRIKVAIWDDRDWLALPIDAQWLYELFTSQKGLDHAGVLTIPRRMWSNLASDEDTADRIAAALKILTDRNFVLVDDETDELLIRTYIRNDNVVTGPPGTFRSAMNSAMATRSPRLRAALHAELLRLDRSVIAAKQAKNGERPIVTFERALAALDPTPKGPGRRRPETVEQAEPAVDNSDSDMPGSWHEQPMRSRPGEGAGAGEGVSLSVGGPVGSASAPPDDPHTDTQPPLSGLLVGVPSRPSEPPGCRVHRALPPEQRPPCRGCLKARERWEDDGRQLAAARRAAAADCAWCQGTNQRQLPPLSPTSQARVARCDHRPPEERSLQAV